MSQDKSAMRAALKDVLKDLKKAMRGKRADRFRPKEEEHEESETDEKVEAMASGRDSDGSSGTALADRDDGGRLPSETKAKSPPSSFREEMMGFMTGRSLKTNNGRSAPVVSGASPKKSPKKASPGPKPPRKEIAG